MKKMINRNWTVARDINTAIEEGYKYLVEGDWYVMKTAENLTEMAAVYGNTWFFTDKEEAEEYAAAQTWIYNPRQHGIVVTLEHEETAEEKKERKARERAAKN